MILTVSKMLLASLLLLTCINFSTSKKSNVFTITSTTTLQRSKENVYMNESEFMKDETDLKSIFTSLLRNLNETEVYEKTAPKTVPSASVELSDTYISFGNISAKLTNLAHIDFSQLANSNVDIIMKVEESSNQRNIQINSTITTDKMTLFGNVSLLGSNYGFTIELAKPTFHLNKLFSEKTLGTRIDQFETFTFDKMTTNLQPKNFNTFLFGRSGLTTNILQRMADSWLPPIIESLNQNSLSHKMQLYEMKLRADVKTSFSHRICRWIKMQGEFSADFFINVDGITSLKISTSNIGSYSSCNCDFFSVKGSNSMWISLVLDYPSEGYENITMFHAEVLGTSSTTTTTTTTTTESQGALDYPELTPITMQVQPTETLSTVQDYIMPCLNSEIRTIEATIEFEIGKGKNKIFKINNKIININKQGPPRIFCVVNKMQDNLLYSELQEKLTEYLMNAVKD